MKPIDVFKCLSDQSRLNIVNMLLKKPMYVELIASSLDLANSTVSFHLKKLEAAGIVRSYKEQYYSMYALNKEILELPLSELVVLETRKSKEIDDKEKEYKRKVLKTFFPNQILTQIPKQRKKKIIVLEKLAEDFEVGNEYMEKVVNEMISKHHEDFCTLRRDLISEKIFTRENGVYRRVK